MACCGKGREQATEQARVKFEYVGATGLTVAGPVTGNVYRFEEPLARIAVDARDVPAMVLVPKLRRTIH